MRDLPVSRRQFLAISGGAAIWFTASPAELLAASVGDARDATTGAGQGYRVLTTAQAAVFDAFAAQVIPSEAGSPGAREANVTRFVDNGLAGFAKEQRPVFEKGFAALDAEARKLAPRAGGFAALTPAQHIAVMRTVDKSSHDIFEPMRQAVIAGMFANPSYGGNAGKVGWKLIGFEDRFVWQPPFGFYDTDAEMRRHD
jgi:gluconate 2-dehydrogenase gamma chain